MNNENCKTVRLGDVISKADIMLKGILSKGKLEKLEFILPPPRLARKVRFIRASSGRAESQSAKVFRKSRDFVQGAHAAIFCVAKFGKQLAATSISGKQGGMGWGL